MKEHTTPNHISKFKNQNNYRQVIVYYVSVRRVRS